MQEFYAKHADRLTVYQLPPYSPDLSPIEFLWRRVKKQATHLRWFPKFDNLIQKVDETLLEFAGKPQELTELVGVYRELTPAAA